MKLYTSYFGGLATLPSGLTPVCIARGRPRWFKGRSYTPLAPTWAMLKMTRAEFDRAFDAILARLDPEQVAADLGDGAVMLCWEKPHERCHRRRCAEWIEAALGIEVPEFGFDRAGYPSYNLMPSTLMAERRGGK
jgi:hypothetical protein